MAILRSDMEKKYSEMGINGSALKNILAETASERHQSRVEDVKNTVIVAAKIAVFGSVENAPDDNFGIVDAVASGLCLLDYIGIGGKMGVQGASTTRLACFAKLGKGRKQARDGGAWSAAIEEAGRELAGQVEGQSKYAYLNVCPIFPEEGGEDHIGIGIGLPQNEYWKDGRMDYIELPLDEKNIAWAYSLARECLRRLAGLGAWHEEAFMTVQGTATQWAAVVNGINEKMEEYKKKEI